MAVFLSENFAGLNGQNLEAYNPAWSKFTIFGETDTLKITAGQRLRYAGSGTFGGAGNYVNSTMSPSADGYVSVDMILIEQSVMSRSNGMRLYGRFSAPDNLYYVQCGVGSVNAITLNALTPTGYAALGTAVLDAPIGTPVNIKLEMIGSAIKVYRNGAVVISVTDGLVTAAGRCGVSVYYGLPGTTDGQGVHLDNLEAYAAASAPQNLDPSASKAQFKTRMPTWTAGAILGPSPARMEFKTANATVTAVPVIRTIAPAEMQFIAVMPQLAGGATTFDAPAAYSEFRVADITLQSGQALTPTAAYSEFRVASPELEPGPVERTPTPVFSRWGVASVSIAMGLTITADSVASIWRTRKPTLKTRFTCGSLAPLQDRLGARVSQDGGSSCNVGVRGSDGLVQW